MHLKTIVGALIVLVMAMLSVPSSAHLLGSGREHHPWSVDPLAVTLLLLAALAYARGARILSKRKLSNRARFKLRQRYFWFGWGALFIALGTPLDALGEVLFSVHMVQHELLMLLAAPLLVLSRPSSPLLKGAGIFTKPVIVALKHRGTTRTWRWLLTPVAAWIIHAVGLWGWHLPALFNAGLQSTWVHSLQHISFLLIALIFWYALLRPQAVTSAVAVLYLFTTAIHASLLGALLTFSPTVWYTPYLETVPAWGLTALQDQQLGGLIMWMPAGIVFIAAALVLVAGLLRDQSPPTSEKVVPGRFE